MRASRKDYLRLVRLIRHMEKSTTRRLMWAHALGDILEKSNPKFQKKIFIAACGADDEPTNVVRFAERQLEK